MIPFLTIAVPTFNREDKLGRLFQQFLEMDLSKEVGGLGIEILVANNASEDNTYHVVHDYKEALERKGFYFSYVEQKENIGLDANMLSCYTESKGEYVWYCSDDDVIIETLNDIVLDIQKYRPGVCISNFKEGGYGESNLVFDFDGFIKIEEKEEAIVRDIIKFPKITAYIAKRVEIEKYRDFLVGLSGSYYLFAALMMLIVLGESHKLVLRKKIVAMSDDDHRNLRYSPRIFANRYKIANHTLVYLGKTELAKKFETSSQLSVIWCIYFIFLHWRGKYKLEPKILREDIIYVLLNIYRIPLILFCRVCYKKVIAKLISSH
ncbi:MAG: glycosyltransferase family 2 protein [Gammaproteobacteria bacterium]|nr:glycosyltransferase family 2 protein [Gammaproteobacteria bacterium]MDH5801217.1 glycosyltransferase family 2 protein [Gammaproteobacteria bacterium]